MAFQRKNDNGLLRMAFSHRLNKGKARSSFADCFNEERARVRFSDGAAFYLHTVQVEPMGREKSGHVTLSFKTTAGTLNQ